MDEPTFYAEIAKWLEQQGYDRTQIEAILDKVRQYDHKTRVDSLMDSYASGGLTLAAIIEEALRGAEPQ